jgi:hypothetical protein
MKSVIAIVASVFALSAFAQTAPAKKEEAKPVASAPAPAKVEAKKDAQPAKSEAKTAPAKEAKAAK